MSTDSSKSFFDVHVIYNKEFNGSFFLWFGANRKPNGEKVFVDIDFAWVSFESQLTIITIQFQFSMFDRLSL